VSIHKNEVTIPRPDYLGGGSWNLRGLNSINVLLGRNGCGKSILLRALRDLSQESSHYIVPERTGDITFEAGLMAESGTSAGRKNRSSSNFSANYRQGVVTRIQAYYTTRGTKKVEDIGHNPEDLMKLLSIILPDFKVSVKSESPFYDLKRVKDDAFVTSVSSMSSGESQLLTIGMDILTIVGVWELDNIENRTLLIDEPDAHIHPDLQIKFADFINIVANEYNVQIVVATHSTTLLSALGQFGKDKVSLLYLRPDKEQLIGEKYNLISKEIASFLGGHLIMGPLFAAPVFLVEGDDDYRIWVQVARSGNVDICVLPCNGEEIKKYRITLEKMFEALSEDISLRGLALLDGDKPLPQNHPGSPQNYVPFVQLGCHESENLYLADEVLSELGFSWSEATSKIISEADNYGNKTGQLKAIGGINRKTNDVKNIINEIAEILDPKKLLWTVRLGKLIGRGKPVGMLEEFIGEGVINTLWKNIT
jgi:energy-coupling factor transporter ATP-binding protein EcfA2